ncbi:class I SAM-dependent methyltransferase [Candidatus Microgenomates bacterium]|nr:class I SAM-dependent methyltransferase [Candidatus Microgenomates bacterium]
MKKEQNCLACGRKLTLLGKNKGASIFKCLKCGLGVTQSVRQENYQTYHRDPVYLTSQKQFRNIFSKRMQILSEFRDANYNGKALEVGSSTGLILSLLKESGWEVLGIEPSHTAASNAREKGIATLNTTFENAKLPPRSFDLVIFNHVLEHLTDPVKTLQKTNKVLRKKGLVFIDVPNFASFSARVERETWRYILPKEHLWHFTPTALFMLLQKAGFKVLYWETHSGIWDYGNPLQELWESLTTFKKRFFVNIITLIPSLISSKMGAGSGLTVVAEKVHE